MSFQGDVAGIGLGELLQGLSRGGRDGVLSLYGSKLSGALGLQGGQLYLIAGPDEKEDLWRERSQRAYADDPQPEMESNRRRTIARANRLEIFYQMLEAPNLHFRFEPGPLPLPAGLSTQMSTISLDAPASNRPSVNPWGQGITVEYVLLEHARIKDESSAGYASRLSGYDVPRALDPSRYQTEVRDFLEQCDGTSTLQEISDRMGWPLSQCRGIIGEHINAGTIRIAQPRELLAGSQRELLLGRIGRAADRLTGWLLASPPGPPDQADAHLLIGEWESGRLAHLLPALTPTMGRALLRKLDAVHEDAHASVDRWHSFSEAHPGDEITRMHEATMRLVAIDEPDTRTFHDLLRLARSFQERGLARRTRTLLKLAAGRLPARPHVRAELGRRMLQTGLVEEGSRWLLNAARELNHAGEAEKAIVPIRAVLREYPDHEDAHSLLIETRALLAKKRRRRWNTLIGLSAGLILSLVALVKFRSYREVSHWMDEINALSAEPDAALAMIAENFGEEPPTRIEDLRSRLESDRKERNKDLQRAWLDQYTEIEEACRFGDPVSGLRLTLELTTPPQVADSPRLLPTRQDLLGILASRFGERSNELDLPVDASLEELNREERLIDLLDQVLALIDPESAPIEAQSFHFRVTELLDSILERRERRAAEREAIQSRERMKNQDILLATARAHDQAGDLERAINAYDRLLASEPGLIELPKLQKEIGTARAHWEALQRALQLAEDGEHAAAEKALVGVCPRPIEHLLPFKVESRPSGARVTLPDGRVRRTPFVAKSGIGERIQLEFTHDDAKPRSIDFMRPSDLMVYMHRKPERTWASNNRVDAAPIPTGDDHVVADRHGRIQRLDRRSRALWSVTLATLGGIARTPMFLPSKPGFLLVISEDGSVWLIDAASGGYEGPLEIGAVPKRGPALTRFGVTAQFSDGRVAVWTDRLEPEFYEVDSLVELDPEASADHQKSSNLRLLRSNAISGEFLTSPWNDWTVEVTDEHYLVLGPDGRGFTAARQGEWVYLAWESPKAFVPLGRLWVSDEGGLRAYVPEEQELVVYTSR